MNASRTAAHSMVATAASLVGVALLASTGLALAVPIRFEVRVPVTTPRDAVLWLSGDRAELGGWNGAGLALAASGGGLHVGTLELPVGTTFEFKVTRGSWETVEKDVAGGELVNRRGVARAHADTIRIDVATWRDTGGPVAPRAHTLTGEIRRHGPLPSKYVSARSVLVWLPPGYVDSPKRRYGVVYLHDGQNVFDGATSFIPGQEWGADEAADRLIRGRRTPPFIMVAVPNSSSRMSEYTSARDGRHGGGGSAEYFRFLKEELKPFIDRTYRTMKDPAHTAVIGSSLGGLASLDLGLTHPGTFGLIGCVSPSVGWADSAIVHRVLAGSKRPLRIWLDIGTAEGTPAVVQETRALRDALLARGWREGGDLHYQEFEGAAHNEAAWSARVEAILEWLWSVD